MKTWCVIFFVITSVAYSQKEANIWYFGENAGLDFNSGMPLPLNNSTHTISEGCATISDSNGNLLFYTDGTKVWNKNHQIMPNGNGLLGNTSSTQSAIIVPHPGNPDKYFIFTTMSNYHFSYNEGFNYSVVDMALDSGNGDIMLGSKNTELLSISDEKLTAIKKSDSEYWVLVRYNDKVYSYLIDPTGISMNPVVTVIEPTIKGAENLDGYNSCIGSMKFSPDGSKLAMAFFDFVYDQTYPGALYVYDFNLSTGVVSNPIHVSDYIDPYGVEFSPNSSKLYLTTGFGTYRQNPNGGILYQFDLESNNIAQSEKIISKLLPDYYYGALQLGPDGRIYTNKVYVDRFTGISTGTEYLSIIENPNDLSSNVIFRSDYLFLNGAKCNYGLPQFIQSYFNVGLLYEDICYGDTTTFELQDTVDSAIWDFGDPASGANNASTDIQPTHVFSVPGTYEVSVTATIGLESATETISVTIYEPPVATLPPDIILCDFAGDLYIDLVNHSPHILGTLDPDIFGINFYEGLADYNNGIMISNPISYQGPSSFYIQEIVAEVYNKGNPACTDVVTFNVGIDRKPKLKPKEDIQTLVLCDDLDTGSDTDGSSIFDLTQLEDTFLAEPMAGVVYKYYLDAAFTQPIATPEAFANKQNPQTIYFEGINTNSGYCRDVSSFTVEVISLPQVVRPVTLKQCDDDLDGFSAFNLNEVIPKITANATSETINFFETQSDAENNNNSITNPTAYINQAVSSDTVWARVENENGCFRISEVALFVTTTQIPDNFVRDFYVCDDDSDGISTFDFSSVHEEIETIFPMNQQLVIAYYRNEADALAEMNPILDISNYQNIGYPNSQQIYVRVDSDLDNDCLGLGAHINLYVEPRPVANPVTMERQCDDDNDGMFPFDVSQVEADVLSGQSLSDVSVSYFDENNNPLPSPLPNTFLTQSQTITIRVSNNRVTDGSCYAETTLEFIVDAQPIANAVPNQIACDDGLDDSDGFHEFDTSSIESTILNGQTGMEVHYFAEDGAELPSPLPNPFSTTSQAIEVRVVNPINNFCYATTSFDFIVNPLPEFSIDTPQIVCSSDPSFTVVLDPIEENPSEVFDYEWTFEDGAVLSNDPTLTVSTPGTYTITLTKTDGTGCSRTREIFVNASESPNITEDDITITDISNNNSITISTTNLGQGEYEFSLDNEFSNYQDDPYFSNVKEGIHTLFVRDKKGCGTSSIEVSVIGYPKYFTPNGDGTNDYWHIKGVNGAFQTNSDIFIYDRYGKLLKQLATTSQGWDGTFNGGMLPTDDYWFSVTLEDGRIFKGHFALKR